VVAVGAIVLAGGSAKASQSQKGDTGPASPPDPGPKPDEPPAADEEVPPAHVPPASSLERFPGLEMVDLRAKASPALILRMRTLEETTAVVLHQTGFFGWKPDNSNWAKIHAHFVVRRNGQVCILYDPEVRMTTGSNAANRFAVTIEHEGNYPNSSGNFYKPEKFGRSYLADAPNQIAASRRLLEILHGLCPKMSAVFAHCQWSDNRQNCCGPDLWREIGQWAVDNLAMTDGGPGWKWGSGQPIPNSWRGQFV
jgi:hypothetical protein